MKSKKNSKDILRKKITKSKVKKVSRKPRVLDAREPVIASGAKQSDGLINKEIASLSLAMTKLASPPKPSWNLRVFRWRTKFTNIAKREITLFPKSNLPISFKPFLAVQGFVVFLLFATIASFFIPQQGKFNEALVIKSAVTKQNTVAVAQGNPVQWTTLVKRSDITLGKAGQYLLKLPKGATNIKIQTITSQQATALLNAKPKEQLSLAQRQQLALSQSKKSNSGLLAKLSTFLFADLGDAVDNVIETITQPETLAPSDDGAVVVDLSAQVDLSSQAEPEAENKEAKEEKQKEEKEEKPNEDKQEQESELAETPTLEASVIASDSEAIPTPIPDEIASSPTPRNDETATEDSPSPAPSPSPEPTPTPDVGEVLGEVLPTVLPTDILETTSPSDSPVIASSSEAILTTPSDEIASSPAPRNDETKIDDVVQITYDTPAPTITEQATDTGKLVTVSDDPSLRGAEGDEAISYTDVLAFTNIPEIYKVGQESKIKIKWKSEGNQEVAFHAYDKDNNGKLDYVEWTVPHLSEQIFEIIFISKAFELDENQNIVSDIYDTVKTQDQDYAAVPQGNYIRVTFEQVLDNTKDITMYMRPTPGSASAKIEVYPVYADAEGNLTQGPRLDLVADGMNPDFSNITADGKYRVLLSNLDQPTDVFDLKIVPAQ